MTTIATDSLAQALSLRDLTDPLHGPHAMQLLLDQIHTALHLEWQCPRLLHRASPIVSVADNYDRLCYPADGAARDTRYSRYLTRDVMLRTQTSAMIPQLLRSLSLDPPSDVLLVCPGLTYRRDTVDRLHTGEPHQVDLWRIKRGRLDSPDLATMIGIVMKTALPGHTYRTLPSAHPYTRGGLQIDVLIDGEWIEVGECGVAAPQVLQASGLDPQEIGGLAMGLGLDRLLMLRKGVPDIRLLRADDPRIANQMLDLDPYRPVSQQPPICRDLSLAIDAGITAEELGDHVRRALGTRQDELEEIEILSETPYSRLPQAAIERMGMQPTQKNVLLRLTIRHPSRSLTHEEANRVRDQVYGALHEGRAHEWAATVG